MADPNEKNPFSEEEGQESIPTPEFAYSEIGPESVTPFDEDSPLSNPALLDPDFAPSNQPISESQPEVSESEKTSVEPTEDVIDELREGDDKL